MAQVFSTFHSMQYQSGTWWASKLYRMGKPLGAIQEIKDRLEKRSQAA
jgi:hypothetical protein